MSKIILTTCGTSLFTSSCWKIEQLNEQPLSVINKDTEVQLQKAVCDSVIRNQINNGPEYLAKYFDVTSWNDINRLRDLPAELASLKAILQLLINKNKPLTEEDKIVLLSSATVNGIYCAKVTENVLKGLNNFPTKNIETIIEAKLDPDLTGGFGEAINNLWKNYNKPKDDTYVYFNLTGGYKPVGYILTAVAYKLTKTRSQIFYLNEDSSSDELLCFGFDNISDISLVLYDIQKNQIIGSTAGPEDY